MESLSATIHELSQGINTAIKTRYRCCSTHLYPLHHLGTVTFTLTHTPTGGWTERKDDAPAQGRTPAVQPVGSHYTVLRNLCSVSILSIHAGGVLRIGWRGASFEPNDKVTDVENTRWGGALWSVLLTSYYLGDQFKKRWVRLVARMGDKRGAYRVLVRKLEGTRPAWRPRHKWDGNTKIDLKVEWGGMGWIDLAQDWDRCLVNMVINLRVPKNAGNFMTWWGTLSYSVS